MSESDPFGRLSKAAAFDPDAPIKKTSAAQQMADAFPPGYEEPTEGTNGAEETPASNPPSVSSSSTAASDSAAAAPAAPAARKKFVPPPRFQRPKKVAASADDSDDVVIAVPKSRAPVVSDPIPDPAPPVEESQESSSAVAAPTPAPLPEPTKSTPTESTSNEENPFGTSTKGKVFDPDAPIAKTSAASAFMSEFPPGYEEPADNGLNEPAMPPPKPKPVRKPLLKKTIGEKKVAPAAAAAPAADDSDSAVAASAPSAASSLPPSASASVANSPTLKPAASSSSSVPSMDSEFPDGESGAEEVFSGPLESRLVHKNWKARSQAYEEMRSTIAGVDDDDTDARKAVCDRFDPFLKKMVNDVSVPALEAGLQAAVLWVDKASYDQGAPARAEDLMAACLKKGYSGRPATKTAADSIALLLIECGAADVVLTHLIAGTQNNVPKIAAACAALIVQALSTFGPGVVAFDKLQKALPKILAHTNNLVRSEAMNLAVELYKWMGAIFTNHLKTLNLKSSQEKELEGLFEKTTQGQSRPTKFLRSEAKSGAAAAGGKKKGGAGGEPAAFDPMSLVKPVDICAKLSKGWVDKAVNEKKWQDRKERLVELATLADATAKIETGPAFNDVVAALKKCLKDSNVVLVGDALKCLHGLAKGTRRAGFFNTARQLFPILISLMKEKKSTVALPLTQLLDGLAEFGIVEIPDVMEPLVEGLSDKVSKVRIEVAQYLQRWLAQPRVTDKILKDSIKPLAEALYKVLNDPDVEVRNVGTTAFAELVATVGKRPVAEMLKKLETAEAKRYQKLDQLIRESKKNGSESAESAGAATADEPTEEEPTAAAAATKKPAAAKKSVAPKKAADDKDDRPASASASASSSSSGASTSRVSGVGLKKTASKASLGGGAALGKPSRLERPASAANTNAVDKSEVEESDGAIRRIDLGAKATRVKKDTKRIKGNFREWGPDEIEEMKEQLRLLCSDELHGLLFHKDFSKQMGGIDILDGQCDSNWDGILSISDLLLKWIAWRLCDANTSLLMKALSFTHKLLSGFQSHEASLSEGEANNILPFLIEKVFGHGTDRFRIEAVGIVTIAQAIYTPKGVFGCLIVGYESKNKRVFSECLNESGAMIVKYGVGVCDAKKVLGLMAQTVGASDSHVRAAALGALSAVYATIGETIWTYLGGKDKNAKIPAKQMAMIEARFKTITPPVQAVKETPAPAVPASSSSSAASGSTMSAAAHHAASVVKESAAGPKTPRRSTKLPGSSPAASPPASKSAHVSPRNSISSATPTNMAVPSARQTLPAGKSQAFGLATSRALGLSSGSGASSVGGDGGLPNCFSLDLDSSMSMDGVSKTAPSSPGQRADRTQAAQPATASSLLNNLRTAQSATSSPHGLSSHASAAVFSKALGKPQLVLPQKGSNDPTLIEQLVHYMDSTYASHLVEEEKMDVMKQLWEMVIERAALLAGQSDEITAFLMKQVEKCFVEKDGQLQVNHRLCSTLDSLTRLLLLKLMDDRLKTHPDPACRSLTMAVNVLVLKVLENGDRTSIFHILLNCLQTGTGTGVMTDVRNKTFVDLVVRSLMKLAKNLSNPAFLTGINSLNIPQLLKTIHMFMISHKPTVAAGQPAPVGDDLPTKAVKAILSNLATTREDQIRMDCATAGIPTSSPAYVYIEKMLSYNAKQRAAGATTAAAAAAPVEQPKASPLPTVAAPAASPVATTVAPAAGGVARRLLLDDDSENDAASMNRTSTVGELKPRSAPSSARPSIEPEPQPLDPIQQQLAEIVARTIKPATTQVALKELYEFTVANPTLDIWHAFSQQGDSFRAYVQRSLAREAASKATGSAPPSASPTVASSSSVLSSRLSAAPLASPSASPAASPTTSKVVDSSSSSIANSTALYRARLSVLQDRAKVATASQATTIPPTTTAAATPTNTNTTTTASTIGAPSTQATIDAIRARFKSAKAADENATDAHASTTPTAAAASAILTTQQQPPAAKPPSSIDAIKARIAAMNKTPAV